MLARTCLNVALYANCLFLVLSAAVRLYEIGWNESIMQQQVLNITSVCLYSHLSRQAKCIFTAPYEWLLISP